MKPFSHWTNPLGNARIPSTFNRLIRTANVRAALRNFKRLLALRAASDVGRPRLAHFAQKVKESHNLVIFAHARLRVVRSCARVVHFGG